MTTADQFPALPADRPSLYIEVPVADQNGSEYADDVLSITTSRRYKDGAPALYLEATASRDRSEDTGMEAEGYADITLPLEAAEALLAALPGLIETLRSMPTEIAGGTDE
jgi:hypothetical protein